MEQRWKLTLEYDGSGYLGWQKQPEGRTVQQVLEQGLSSLCNKEIVVYGQGRTDRGVHARGQVAHTDLPVRFSADRLSDAMRGLLPEDLALVGAEPVRKEFHARFDASSRSYSYCLMGRRAPLSRRYCWEYTRRFSPEVLQECASVLKGEHNFRSFCRVEPGVDVHTTCTVFESYWKQDGECWIYHIQGNRFLRHMVRRLVGSMVLAGAGRLDRNDFDALLEGEEPNGSKGFSAPARGLFLDTVSY